MVCAQFDGEVPAERPRTVRWRAACRMMRPKLAVQVRPEPGFQRALEERRLLALVEILVVLVFIE